MNNIIDAVEKIIGYIFIDKNLLIRALTHPSYSYENKTLSYQNMEFLGDSILDFIVAEHLISLFPNYDEGELTKYRADVVAKDPLADVIDNAGLDEYILLGNGTIASRKTRSDIFESITAAIYLDSNLISAKNFVIRFLGEMMKGNRIDNDYKSRLFEIAGRFDFRVDFVLLNTSGPQHHPQFSYEVQIDGTVMGYGEDFTKREAQQEAARMAIKKLANQGRSIEKIVSD